MMMQRLLVGSRFVMMCALVAVLCITISCGSDDENNPVLPQPLTNPAGTWNVTWSPPSTECLFDAMLGARSTYTCQIKMAGSNKIELRQSPLCMALPLSYDSNSRSCNNMNMEMPGPFTIPLRQEDVDGMCALAKDLFGALLSGVDCSQLTIQDMDVKISNLKLSSDLTWADDFKTFSGDISLSGDITVILKNIPFIGEIPIGPESCSITIKQSGTRCDSCTPDC